MSRMIGTVVRGLRAPIIKQNDDMVKIVCDTVIEASKEGGYTINDRDIVTITESVVARAQGNYANVNNIASDVKDKLNSDTVGIIFPILSRNRFSLILKGIALGVKKVIIMLSYPSDEVGNHFITYDELDKNNINPWKDEFDEKKFRELFENPVHEFTGVDYIKFYKDIVKEAGADCEIVFANDPKSILKYTKNVINCDIHTRKRTKRILLENGGEKVFSLDDILTSSVDGSGYSEYGLLGSNKATEDTLKLFPRNSQDLVEKIQAKLKELTGKNLEVMVYGDGAFKDPVGKIWELADPVVSPGYTSGLKGTPSEIKLKYIADNDFADLRGDELKNAVVDYIKNKESDLVGKMASEGTTPRQLTDLLGSLSDLTSGSGDKGTPIIYIQGYFDNYTN
ncbi:F420-0:Gamma-glutamyl ligase [Peptoanaerobacter stomatis]|uniref:F420-0:Gamma-glutamyl ligase n=1 Tax=Peptoanaerobacter stomatis TaxID=796937 RepID=J6H8B2_9FIRM|nr:coenzyme F420-0:L-glutamate ligase [Peptoanaerobacter stomatis]EJU21460.1 F420-0:Gamma-glutamyl ligase [Peptoanaerobacter stomatis]NWO24698.1 coenzyme F420-0:L-glutamate ligase [Peptostreptococcaceae bacterium oral taxon 081]